MLNSPTPFETGLPMREPQSITVNEDERLIPVWSIVAAVAAFVLVEYYFWLVLPDGKHKMPLGLRIYFNFPGDCWLRSTS
jgi:hypothetical protein